MEIDRKTLRTIFWGAAGCIGLYWLLHETERLTALVNGINDIMFPFIVGAAFAFILNVPMRAIERHLKCIKKSSARRGVAILLTLLMVILIIVGAVQLLIPQIVDTVESLVDTLPDFFKRVQNGVMEYLKAHPELMEWLNDNTDFQSINWQDILQKVVGVVSTGLTTILNTAYLAVLSISAWIFNAVLSLVFAIYCLFRKEILARQGRRLLYALLPEKHGDETVRIMRLTNTTFSNFISGQCLEAVILGCMFAVSMLIFKMPYMPLVSVIIAITALIPIVGAFIGCVLGAFFILVDNPVQAVWFVVMFLVLQQIEGNLIYPKVVGSSIGLPGMWVLVAVAVGGDLMGIGGMLLMIPLASVAYALLREFTNKRLEAKHIDRAKLNDQPIEISRKFGERRKSKDKADSEEAKENVQQ